MKRGREESARDETFDFISSLQAMSRKLKSKRASSHPERDIGRTRKTVIDTTSTVDGSSQNGHLLATSRFVYGELKNFVFTSSCLQKYQTRPYAQYFVFSLLLDLLKVDNEFSNIDMKAELSSLVADTIPYWSSSSHKKICYMPLLDKQLSILVKLTSILSQNIIDGFSNGSIDPCHVHKIAHHLFIDLLTNCEHIFDKINWGICTFVNEYDVTPSVWSTILNSLLSLCEDLLRALDHIEFKMTSTFNDLNIEMKLVEFFILICDSLMNMATKIDSVKLMQLSSDSDQILVSSLIKFLQIQVRVNANSRRTHNEITEDGTKPLRCKKEEYFALKRRKSTELINFLNERKLDPISMFLYFCSFAICLDHSLAVDLITSPETECLQYFIRITKQILAARTTFEISFLTFLETCMDSSPTLRSQQSMLRCIESQSIPTTSSSSNSRVAVILVKQDIEDLPLSTSKKSPEAVMVDWKVPTDTDSRSFDEHNMSYLVENSNDLHSKFKEFFDSFGRTLTVMHRKKLLPFDPSLLTERFSQISRILPPVKRKLKKDLYVYAKNNHYL